MGRKYEFTGKTLVLEYSKIKLRQIIRISDGLVGGWIQSENNLRNEGNCFVYDNAKVYGNARVYDNAEVCNKAEVYGDARVEGDVGLSDNDILTNHCDHFTFREFDINVTDNHLKIGCERHKKEEWPLLLEGLIKKYDVKHPDVYRFFVNYYCKKWILS